MIIWRNCLVMIKVFIFNFDDTLYYNVNWKEWNDFKLNYYLQHITHVKNTTFKNSLENGEESDSSEMNISKILLEQGMRVDEWTKVRDAELLSFIKRQSPIVVPEAELKKFAKVTYNIKVCVKLINFMCYIWVTLYATKSCMVSARK